MRSLGSILLALTLTSAIVAPGCDGDSHAGGEPAGDDPGDSADSTTQSLAGSYYAFDGTNLFVLMLSRFKTVGKGTFVSFAGGLSRGDYTVVDDRLVLNPGKPGELTSTFTRSGNILTVTNLFGTGVFFHGPAFCELAQDCFAQADPPQDATWGCVNFMCQPVQPTEAECADVGGVCLSDPGDVGFPALCSNLGLIDLDAKCAAFNQACCGSSPVEPL